MNTLKYKDFIGSVAFSEADNVFFGKIEGIDGLIYFEGRYPSTHSYLWLGKANCRRTVIWFKPKFRCIC